MDVLRSPPTTSKSKRRTKASTKRRAKSAREAKPAAAAPAVADNHGDGDGDGDGGAQPATSNVGNAVNQPPAQPPQPRRPQRRPRVRLSELRRATTQGGGLLALSRDMLATPESERTHRAPQPPARATGGAGDAAGTSPVSVSSQDSAGSVVDLITPGTDGDTTHTRADGQAAGTALATTPSTRPTADGEHGDGNTGNTGAAPATRRSRRQMALAAKRKERTVSDESPAGRSNALLLLSGATRKKTSRKPAGKGTPGAACLALRASRAWVGV